MTTNVYPHDTFKLFVTHVERAGNLLVVLGQRDRDAAVAIEHSICRHSAAFAKGESAVNIKEVSTGQLCCAAYEDSTFYRARVIDIHPDTLKVTVLFVDYGNVETLPISAIRSVAGLSGAITDTPPLASSYLLSRLVSNWNAQKLEFVSSQLKYEEFTCFVDGSVRTPLLIKIMYMNNDYAEYLANHGIGSFIPLQQYEAHVRPGYSGATNVPAPNPSNPMWQRIMPTPGMIPAVNGTGSVINHQMPTSGMPTVGPSRSVVNHMAPPSSQNGNCVIAPRPPPPPGLAPMSQVSHAPPAPQAPSVHQNFIRMRPPPQQPAQYKSCVLEPGSNHQVFVSHVEDGPLAFSVQLLESHPQLVSMMQEINSRAPEPVTSPLHAGMMCLARFMEDLSLCRALILFKSDETGTCRVYYVDYGNSDDVPFTHVFAIPPDFCIPKVLCYRCALNGVHGATITLEEKKIFKDLVQGLEATLVVCTPDGTPNKHFGNLFIDGKDVKALIKEKMNKKTAVLRYPKVQMPQAGSREEVVISFVDETSKSFFVQLASYSDALNTLMDSVHNHCTESEGQPLQQEDKVPGMPCCAKYTDESWYRAVILNCFGEDVVVMYVDYGNEAKVKFAELVKITPQLVMQLRVQAIPCLLESKENSNKLKEMEGQSFTMHVITQKDAFVSVRLYDSDGNDVMRPPAAKPQITSPPSKWNDTALAQQPSFNDRGKGRPFDKAKMSSPGEDSGFNEDQNWRKPARTDRDVNNEESSRGFNDRPKRQFGDGDDRRGGLRGDRDGGSRFGDKGDGGGRFADRDRSRGFENDDKGGFRGGDRFGDKPRGGFGDGDDRGRFGDRDRRGGDRGDGRFGDKDRRGGFGDREEGGSRFGDGGDKPRGGFRDRGDSGTRGRSDDGGDRRAGFGGDRQEGGGRFGGKGRFGDRNDGGGRFGSGGGGRYGGGDSSEGKTGGFSNAVETKNWGDYATSATPIADAAPSFPFSNLEGTSEDVSFVFGGQSKFFVHKRPENPDFTQLGETISSTYSEEKPSLGASDVKTGLLCIAFSADYEGWYRARILNPIEGGAHVSFIDYGNSEDVYYDKLKAINDDLKTLPPQAIPCTLRGVPVKEWSETEMGDFAVFGEAELRATFVELNDEVFSTVLVDTATQETANEKFGATPESLQPLAATYYVPNMTVESGISAQVEVPWFINPNKFYIQFQTSKNDLANLMQSIQDNFKNLKPLKTCEPGWFVLAKFKEDKVVYRAQVKKADGSNEFGVEFIDYGNSDLVEKSSLYSMEPEYVALPRQAIRSKLDGVSPIGEAWPPAGSSDLDNSFMGEMTCTVVRVDDDCVVVSLNRGRVDVATELIEKDLATGQGLAGDEPQEIDLDLLPGQVVSGRVTYVNAEDKRIHVVLEKSVADQLDEQLALSVAEPEALAVLTADYNVVGTWCLVSTSLSKYLRAEIVDPTCASGVLVKLVDVGSCEEVAPDKMFLLNEDISMIPAQAIDFKFDGSAEEGQEVVLKVSLSDDGLSAAVAEEDLYPLPILRKSAKVYVPFTNNTTVWIQLVSCESHLAELLDKLFEAYDSTAEDSFTPAVGALCAAKSINDETWYRGRVAEVSEEGVTVSYVDYGNTEVLPKENLRELLPDFKSHALARDMQLPITSSDDLSAEIAELTANTAFDAEFATKDGLWQIELKQPDGAKLSQAMIDLGKATRREDCFFPAEFTAVLSHLESLGEIYVHDEKKSANLEALQAELQTLAETLEDGVQEVGSVCLALYSEDGQWYRAEIRADGLAHFIDYGNADKVDQVKQLPEDKAQFKRFAIKCSLSAPEGKEWTPDDAARATELLAETVTVKVVEDGDPKVVEMVVGGRDLTTELTVSTVIPEEEVPTDTAGDADGEQLLADDKQLPDNNERPPADGEQLPADAEQLPADGEQLPADGEQLPADGEQLPADGEQLPADGEQLPADGEQLPADGEQLPADGEQLPADGEQLPADGEQLPADGEQLPADGEQLPADGEQLPADGEQLPADGEQLPADGEQLPADGEQLPADGEQLPADEEQPASVYECFVKEVNFTKAKPSNGGAAEPEVPAKKTAIDPDVGNADISELVREGDLLQANEAEVSEPAFEEQVVVSEPPCEELIQVEDAEDTEPAYEEQVIQVENAEDTNPVCEEQFIQVENAEDTDLVCEEQFIQAEDAEDADPVCEEQFIQVKETKVSEIPCDEVTETACEERLSRSEDEVPEPPCRDQPERSYEERPSQVDNAEVSLPVYEEQLSQPEERTIPQACAVEETLPGDFSTEGLPSTSKLDMTLLVDTEEEHVGGIATVTESPLLLDEAIGTSETKTKDVSEKLIQNEAGVTNPAEETKDALEVPFSMVEKDENSDTKETPLLQNEVAETVKDDSCETEPEEKSGLDAKREEVQDLSAVVKIKGNLISSNQEEKSDSIAQLPNSAERVLTKEETSGQISFADVLDSKKDSPSQSPGKLCPDSVKPSEEEKTDVDATLRVIKKVDSLLSLTEELLTETSELAGAGEFTSSQDGANSAAPEV